MHRLLVLVVLIAAFAIPATSHATDTTVGYAFYGPAGDYKIELFEVGAPYPSRQDIVNDYGGYFTYRRNWYAIVSYRLYFVRVTDLNSGVAKQTGSYYITGSTFYQLPTCYWNSM